MGRRSASNCFTYKDLTQYLPCFYDVPLIYIHRSCGLSVKGIIKAREAHGNGVMDTWPFVTIKQDINPHHSWASVMQERNKAIQESTNPHVITMLQKAARKAEQLRLICHTPFERVRLRLGEDNSYPATQHILSPHDLQLALHHMIDLPLKTVEQLLRMSLHTIYHIRTNIGLTKWPYEPLCRGVYPLTMSDVAANRDGVMQSLKEGTALRMVLEDAAAVADTQTIHPKYTYAKCMRESPSAPMVETVQTIPENTYNPPHPEEQPLFKSDDEDTTPPLFAASDDYPAPPPPPADDEDDFWGTNTDLSPASRAYWDSLADLSDESFT